MKTSWLNIKTAARFGFYHKYHEAAAMELKPQISCSGGGGRKTNKNKEKERTALEDREKCDNSGFGQVH